MDTVDVKILKLLQKNARVSVSEISNKINLSLPAASDRLKKLEKTGIIKQYTTIINPESLNKNLTAIMFVSLERPNFNDGFIEFINRQNEIIECHYLAGNFDYSLKIITDNTSTLEILLNKIKNVQGIQKTSTIVTLSTIKNSYSVTPDDIQEIT